MLLTVDGFPGQCHLLEGTRGTELRQRRGMAQRGQAPIAESLRLQPSVCTADLSREIFVFKDLLESHELIE